MEQRKFELKMQELKLQYTKKSNEINRKKDGLDIEKRKTLIACDDEFYNWALKGGDE